MAYEINGNTYTTLKRCEAWEEFEKRKYIIDRATDIDSIWANRIIVKEGEEIQFHNKTQQECIDLKITLGYIELKV